MALKLFLSRWIRGIKRSSSANLPTNIYSSALNNLHYTLTFTALWTACQPSRHTHALASIRREGRSSEEMKWRTPRRLFSLWRKTPSFHANLATEVIFAFHCLFTPQHPKQTDLWPLAIFLWPRGTLAAWSQSFQRCQRLAPSQPGRTLNACKHWVCEHWLFQPLGHRRVCTLPPWRFVNGDAWYYLLLKWWRD